MTPTDLVVLAVPTAALVLVAVLLVVVVRLRRDSRRTTEELRRTREQAAALEARLDELARPVPPGQADPRVEPQEFLITRVGEEPTGDEAAVPARIEGRLFADIVLRESVVRAAGVAHGVRRALAPETRHRIRFEMRRELRRARRRRREELRGLRRGTDRPRRKAA